MPFRRTITSSDGTRFDVELASERKQVWFYVQEEDWPWRIGYRLAGAEDGFRVGEVRIFPAPLADASGAKSKAPPLPSRPLSQRDVLEHLRMERHLHQLQPYLDALHDEPLLERVTVPVGIIEGAGVHRSLTGPGRRRDALWYAVLAKRYLTLLADPTVADEYEVLKDEYGFPSLQAARDAIYKARNRPHLVLGKTTRGRKGGQLTERGRQLLAGLPNEAPR